ncbi:ompA family protein [Burkholderia cenocepacia]|nr:ompA family protein [Burkholderia cenocepacia]
MKFSSLVLRSCVLGAIAVALGACATQSGPTYSIRALSSPEQQEPIYRVTCAGMLSSSNACVAAAQKFCTDKGMTQLHSVDRVRDGVALKDPREINFMCGKPSPKPAAHLPPPQPPQPAPQPASRPQVLLQGNAHFATDSAALTVTARRALDQFLGVNGGVEFRRVTVTGYTDSTGSVPHNQRLSEARARSVISYLRIGGLQAQQFIAEGRGAADPVATNSTAEGRAQNRRVEIRLATE